MERDEILKELKEVKDIIPTNKESLIEHYKNSGFQGLKLGRAIEIIKEMVSDKDCFKFLTFPACIIATGLRGIIKELIKKKLFDAIITTNGTIDHDLARSFKSYYKGFFNLDDKELRKLDISRLGNILLPVESYGFIIEEKMRKILEEVYEEKKELSSYELNWEIGKRLNESSILYWAYKNKIPVFVPGFYDGAVGYQVWLFQQKRKDFLINLRKDEDMLNEIIWDSKKTGALIIGGGISKHHCIWWNQFKDGLDYAVYLTTSLEYDGSLSGAQPREAVSWKKIKEKGKKEFVIADVTITLPIIYLAINK